MSNPLPHQDLSCVLQAKHFLNSKALPYDQILYTFVNHILDRHGPNSSYTNKSHFNSSFDIKSGIESTLKGDNFILKPNTNGRNGYIFEQTFSNPIGTNVNGKPLNTLKAVIDENVKDASSFCDIFFLMRKLIYFNNVFIRFTKSLSNVI